MIWKKILLWVLAAVLTIGASVYQRKTGPTYPLDFTISIAGDQYAFELTRSASIGDGCIVEMPLHEEIDSIRLVYQKYPGTFEPDTVLMPAGKDAYLASLPIQPAAGKLRYHMIIYRQGNVVFTNEDNAAVVRFKGDVPAWALIPHVLAMFLAMLFSTAAMLMAITRIGNFRKIAWWAFGSLFVGGFIFGPVVQHFAFGQAWTGFPVGMDLTDNKTLIAGIFWLAAVLLNLKKKRRWAVIIAGIVLLAIYIIPHSARGSEFDYETEEVKTG
ncbi:MAG: hypothetical protein ACLFM1_08205 [Bacteroidales bacterium]